MQKKLVTGFCVRLVYVIQVRRLSSLRISASRSVASRDAIAAVALKGDVTIFVSRVIDQLSTP